MRRSNALYSACAGVFEHPDWSAESSGAKGRAPSHRLGERGHQRSASGSALPAQLRIPGVAEGCVTQRPVTAGCPASGRRAGHLDRGRSDWVCAASERTLPGASCRRPADEKVSLRKCHGRVGIDRTDGTANSRRTSELRNIIAGQAISGSYLGDRRPMRGSWKIADVSKP